MSKTTLPAQTFNLFDIDPARIHFGELEQKTIDTEKGPQTIYSFPFVYVLGDDPNEVDESEKCSINIQFPEVASPYGIKSGKFGSTIIIPVRLENPDTTDKTDYQKIFDAVCAIYDRIVELCYKKRNALGMKNFKKEDPVATGLKHMIWQPNDSKRDYLMILNLINAVNEEKGTTFKTKFTTITSKGEVELPWDVLSRASIRHYPLVSLGDVLSSAGKMTIRSKLRATVVTSLKPKEEYNPQKELTERIMKDNPMLALQIEKDLLELNKVEKEKLKEFQQHNQTVSELQSESKEDDPLASLPKTPKKALPPPSKPKTTTVVTKTANEDQAYHSPPEDDNDYPQQDIPKERSSPPPTSKPVTPRKGGSNRSVILSRNPVNQP